MSSASRHEVTITLGSSGQVVKRGAISDFSNSNGTSTSGRKRPVRERLGNNVDDSHFHDSKFKSKRLRMEGNGLGYGDDDLGDDEHFISNRQIGKDDLRLKLMRKGLSKSNGGAQQNGGDLREKLSRKMRSLPRYDAREKVPQSRASGFVRRIPSARSADDLLQLDSVKKPYSSWTLDGLGRKSPDRLMHTSRAMSPSRNYDDIRTIESMRPLDNSRPSTFMRREAADRPSTFTTREAADRSFTFMTREAADRPSTFMTREAAALRSAPYINKSNVPVDNTQPIGRVPPAGSIVSASGPIVSPPVQKNPVMPEPLTVADLLNSVGLNKYLIILQAEEVDMAALKQMGDNDLKEVGIPMGPRKKILQELARLSKQRHR